MTFSAKFSRGAYGTAKITPNGNNFVYITFFFTNFPHFWRRKYVEYYGGAHLPLLVLTPSIKTDIYIYIYIYIYISESILKGVGPVVSGDIIFTFLENVEILFYILEEITPIFSVFLHFGQISPKKIHRQN